VTDRLRRRLGRGFRFHRLVYNLVAAVTLVPVLALALSLRGPAIVRWEGPVAVAVQGLVLATAAVLFVAGARRYDLARFLGLRQIAGGRLTGTLGGDAAIETRGIHAVVRHPWYLATLLVLWGRSRAPDASTLVTDVVLTGYVLVGTWLEERKLVGRYGEEYRRYQEAVPMLVPFPLALLPVLLALLLLAAHFLRAELLPLVALSLALGALTLVRRPWAARILQAALVLGAMEWVRTLAGYASARAGAGEPVVRLVAILGSVAAGTGLAALLFRRARMRSWFRVGGDDQHIGQK